MVTIQEYRLGTISHTKNEMSGAKSTTPVRTLKVIAFDNDYSFSSLISLSTDV